MKFSENWLRQLVEIEDISTDDLLKHLSMAGLEVEACEKVAGDFSNVVVAEILEAIKHPKADKLQVCKVSDGTETFQVVCGAPNARVGIKVPFAKVGAKLDDFQIKIAQLREVESFGMLCSAKELGISDDHSGLLELPLNAELGKDLREYLDLNDNAIEISITPNRGDCLSLIGIARDVAAIYGRKLKNIDIKNIQNENKIFEVEVLNSEKSPYYSCSLIEGVDVSTPTPIWMQEKLRRSGIRSIDILVDITNFVMLEFGTPLHAFDKAMLDSKIIVRNAKNDEQLTLLNGQEITLNDKHLVIADKSKILALAGIMGGEHSGINKNTKDVVLEAAYFTQEALAGVARSFGLNTDASYRYERGVDYSAIKFAMQRATGLIMEIAGGKASIANIVQNQEFLPKPKHITLSKAKLTKLLGIDLNNQTKELLERLGCKVQEEAEQYKVIAPVHRFDLNIAEDLIEEVARLFGYDNIPYTLPNAKIKPEINDNHFTAINNLRNNLIDLSFNEVITYSFIDEKTADLFSDNKSVALQNPISQDMAVMRQSLIPGLIKTTIHNFNHQQTNLKFFEIGQVFVGNLNNLSQNEMLCGLMTGLKLQENWTNGKDKVDFYDLKAVLTQILPHDDFSFIAENANKTFHPGRTAKIIDNKTQITIGFIGQLHPTIAANLDIKQEIYVFEVALTSLLTTNDFSFKEISKFPVIERDLSLLVPNTINADRLISLIKEKANDNLLNINIFDIYKGKGINENFASIAVKLNFSSNDKTLTDEEISLSIEKILQFLETQNISLRA